MASRIDLYVGADAPLAIKRVLTEGGYQVRARPRRLTTGARGMEYEVCRQQRKASVLEAPAGTVAKVEQTYLRCVAAPKDAAMLLEVVELLKAGGASEQAR